MVTMTIKTMTMMTMATMGMPICWFCCWEDVRWGGELSRPCQHFPIFHIHKTHSRWWWWWWWWWLQWWWWWWWWWLQRWWWWWWWYSLTWRRWAPVCFSPTSSPSQLKGSASEIGAWVESWMVSVERLKGWNFQLKRLKGWKVSVERLSVRDQCLRRDQGQL